jgi:hypothetical protein
MDINGLYSLTKARLSDTTKGNNKMKEFTQEEMEVIRTETHRFGFSVLTVALGFIIYRYQLPATGIDSAFMWISSNHWLKLIFLVCFLYSYWANVVKFFCCLVVMFLLVITGKYLDHGIESIIDAGDQMFAVLWLVSVLLWGVSLLF